MLIAVRISFCKNQMYYVSVLHLSVDFKFESFCYLTLIVWNSLATLSDILTHLLKRLIGYFIICNYLQAR